jgi:hypothetical protein
MNTYTTVLLMLFHVLHVYGVIIYGGSIRNRIYWTLFTRNSWSYATFHYYTSANSDVFTNRYVVAASNGGQLSPASAASSSQRRSPSSSLIHQPSQRTSSFNYQAGGQLTTSYSSPLSSLKKTFSTQLLKNTLSTQLTLSRDKVMLQLTASRTVFIGIKHPSGAHDQILWLSESCDRSVVYSLCWTSPVFLGPESRRTHGHILWP